MKKLIVTLAALAILASLFITPAVVSARPADPLGGGFLNAGGIPADAKLVVNVTLKVTNDEDSGNVGYWALDSYNKHIQVWMTPDNVCYAVVRYEGKWETFF